jgi:triosephosphate isomerase
VRPSLVVSVLNGLTPLFCIGELLEEREAGNTETVVARQINAVIKRVGIEAFKNIIIAYEPDQSL